MNNSGEFFLNKLYKDLADSKEVLKSVEKKKKSISISREDRIKIYMDRLEKIHNNPNLIQFIKKLYHNKYVIKEQNIKIKSLNGQTKKTIIKKQEESLDKWINYLTNENAKYPMWAKYWAFQGMLRIGDYDEANGTYFKRTKNTIAPFIEANPEIIAKCIDTIVKFVNKENISEEEVSALVKTGSFLKLYTFYKKRFKKNIFITSAEQEGIWIKYKKNNKEDAIKLANSLQGYGTGWCTSSQATAINQLCGGDSYIPGDFYVYYTKDENFEYKVPRIAIRLEDSLIVEVRGVDESQNLEDGLEEILKEKLQTLDNKNVDRFLKIVNNIKKISKINYKNSQKINLTEDEIIFLYEITEKIETFGLEEDPRIKKIRNSRDPQTDYNSLKNKEFKIMFLTSQNIKKITVIDKEISLEAVKRNGLALRHIDRNIDNYQNIALEAMKNNGLALQYIDKNISNYITIVTEAAKQNVEAFKWIDKNIPDFQKIAITATLANGLSLQYVDPKTKDYDQLALAAAKINGYSIKYVDKNTKNYDQIAMEAIKQNCWSFQYIDKNTKKYKAILIEAVKKGPRILDFVDVTIENYKELAISAITANPQALSWLNKKSSNYKEIVLEIVTKNNFTIQYMPAFNKYYTEIALKVVKQNGLALQYIAEYVKDYKEIAIEAIKQNILAIQYVNENNKNYNEILLEALKIDRNILNKVNKTKKYNKNTINNYS